MKDSPRSRMAIADTIARIDIAVNELLPVARELVEYADKHPHQEDFAISEALRASEAARGRTAAMVVLAACRRAGMSFEREEAVLKRLGWEGGSPSDKPVP